MPSSRGGSAGGKEGRRLNARISSATGQAILVLSLDSASGAGNSSIFMSRVNHEFIFHIYYGFIQKMGLIRP